MGENLCEFSASSEILDIEKYKTLTSDQTLIAIHPDIKEGEGNVTFYDKAISKDVNLHELRGETWFVKSTEAATYAYNRLSKKIRQEVDDSSCCTEDIIEGKSEGRDPMEHEFVHYQRFLICYHHIFYSSVAFMLTKLIL